MDLSLLIPTVWHLKPKQVFYQIYYRLHRAGYRHLAAPQSAARLSLQEYIPKPVCVLNGAFSFLNLTGHFSTWNDTSRGMLWAYNLNYMDWLNQADLSSAECDKWIDRFIYELPDNRVGLDPYPVALRGINWIKYISRNSDHISSSQLRVWNDSLYSQYRLLLHRLEYHLLGNHLLEDAYSLYIASVYFCDRAMYAKSTRLLRNELNEQILSDGAHFEQSPMYHCILLDRLLDCCNASFNNMRFAGQESFNVFLRSKASLMLGHLKQLVYKDYSIPLLNDSAVGVAPTAEQLFAYADRLGIEPRSLSMGESGYRKFTNRTMEAIVDVGNIVASYQPGHSHADTFNYELRISGRPYIIDSGISTYDKNQRRQFERGTMAHNTVVVDGQNSSAVWGGFRVGKRAKVAVLDENEHGVIAEHDGFGKKRKHRREFVIGDNSLEVKDTISFSGEAISYIHFASGVEIMDYDNMKIDTNEACIVIEGAHRVEITQAKASSEYNRFSEIFVAAIYFSRHMKYKILTSI